jgi:hypothetical protein
MQGEASEGRKNAARDDLARLDRAFNEYISTMPACRTKTKMAKLARSTKNKLQRMRLVHIHIYRAFAYVPH